MTDEPQAVALTVLGDANAAVCVGDVCYLPSAAGAPAPAPVELGPASEDADQLSESFGAVGTEDRPR